MARRYQYLIAFVATAAALAVMYFFNQNINKLVVTTRVVTPATVVEPYTLITPEMLTTKEVPRPLLAEPIYAVSQDLVGKLATVRLEPGMIIYRSFAVAPADFRLVDDPALEVTSFPVDPSSAVGGQVRIGMLINIYRGVVTQLTPAQALLAPDQLIAQHLAAAELLAGNVRVVDVRSSTGVPANVAGVPAAAAGGPLGPASNASSAPVVPVQIVTVAVPHDVAQIIVQAVIEQQGNYKLWLALAPLE